jgi:hypothetical protein
MKVFLSWSGNMSQQVAAVLRKWLPYMLHSVKPFMSAVDIRKGRWADALSHELEGAQYGIVCVTPFNMHKPWMNFESGALAHLPTLMPFLFRVDRAALGDSPLTQYQLAEFGRDDDRNKTEFFRLVQSINDGLAEQDRVTLDVLTNNFEHWWRELRKELDLIPEVSPGETRTAYRWLRTFEDLAIYDLKAECEAVWFVTSDVFKYAGRAGVREKLEASLDNVRYRYLIPEPDRYNERAAREQLENLRHLHPDRVDYRCFKREVFEKQATSDYVIVESSASGGGVVQPNGGVVKAFVRIPIGETEQEYWFETEERAGIGFYHRFLQLWNSPVDVVNSPTNQPALLEAAPLSRAGLG